MMARSWFLTTLALVALDGCTCEGREAARPVDEVADEPVASLDPEATLGLTPEVAATHLAAIDDGFIDALDVAREIDGADAVFAANLANPEARRALLDTMVHERLFAAEARRLGLDQAGPARRASDEVLAQALTAQMAGDVPPPSDAEVAAYYEAHRADFHDPDLASVSLVFARDEAAAREGLASVIADTRHRGETWIHVAERIGFAGPRNQPLTNTELFAAIPRASDPFVPEAVREAAFATEAGEAFAELVPHDGGFYLVLVQRRIPAADVPLDAVRESIRSQLHAAAIDARVDAIVADTLSHATFDDEALGTVRVPTPGPRS